MKKIRIRLLMMLGIIILPILCSYNNAFAANQMATDSYSFTIVSDTIAPAAVSNLSTPSKTETSVTLNWTAPGDDGSSGTATSYDVRYSTSAITTYNWSSATQASGEPTPSAAGSAQSMTISGLNRETKYYFAIKTSDENANISGLSNVPNTTTPDETAPAAVANLSVQSKTHNTIILAWTAPGDNDSSGTASSYDIRYSTSSINTSNWASATQASGEPTPSAAGTTQTVTISGLSTATTYYFAVKTTDEASNQSSISNVANDTTDNAPDTTPPYTTGHVPANSAAGVSSDSNIIVHVKDDGAGVDQSSIVMKVNGQAVNPTITGTTADYTLTYNPSSDFQNGQTIYVTVDASDLAS